MFQLFQSKPQQVTQPVPGALAGDMTLEQVRRAMLALLAEENVNHHRMGVLYNYVVDRKLAELAQYKNAREYFRQNLQDVSQASLSMYGAVAHQFSEEVARRFNFTSLYLLLTYKDLAEVTLNHEAPGDTPIEVPDEKGGVTSKPFSACSVEDLRKALRARRKPTSSTPLPAEAVALADRVGQAVASRFQKGDPVRVQLRNHVGEPVLDFKGIPLSKCQKLMEALQALGDEGLKA